MDPKNSAGSETRVTRPSEFTDRSADFSPRVAESGGNSRTEVHAPINGGGRDMRKA